MEERNFTARKLTELNKMKPIILLRLSYGTIYNHINIRGPKAIQTVRVDGMD